MEKPPKSIPAMTLCLIAATLLLIGTASAAPSADFSGTPTSGTASLAVEFTDESTGSPTGWAWFFGDETYDQAWTPVNASSGWTARQNHATVAMPDGSIVLMGGDNDIGTKYNDVWRSTDNGATWTQINDNPGWTARQWHTSVAMPNGSIVLMGGNDGAYRNDVWLSTDDGTTWGEVATSGSMWSIRARHASVVMPNGSIVLMGGRSGGTYLNDVWLSDDYGATWREVATSGPMWSTRADPAAVVVDGSIILMGGYAGTTRVNDVWRSDDYGATWTVVNESPGWSARNNHAAVAMPDGSIVLVGGTDGSDRHDVWRSTDNGATWTQLPDAGWTARHDHAAVAMPDGSIVLTGGTDGGLKNDTWRLQPAGSTEQNPTHEYAAAGTYTVALQAFNAGGYDVARTTDYISVTEPVAPTAAFSGTPTSGTAPLAVEFTDDSTGSPTAWNWSFGDGAWFNTTNAAEKNPTHTYDAAGTYTVNLTVGNAAGSDTHTEAGYITVSAAPAGPTASFSGTPTSGAAPLTVQFTDDSTGSPTAWNWSFGDGAWYNTTNAAEKSPAHTYSTAGTYSVSLTVGNAEGADTHTEAGYITVSAAPTPTPTRRPVHSSGGGGSTGGPGGYNVGGDSVVSKVNVTGTGLKTFIVTGWKQSSPGAGIPPAPGTPYQYVDLVPARFEEITGATITFSVPAAWLEEHGFTPEDIVMYHYNGTAWEALPTTVEGTSGTTVTFTATSPGFSLFAITGIRDESAVTTPTTAQTTVQVVAEPTAEQTTAAPAGEPAPEFPLGTVALASGVILVLAAGGFLVRRWWMRRQNPALFRDYD